MWDTRGKVELKTSSATVTGIDTDFNSVSRVGDAFIGPDGRMYEITSILSPNSLTISPTYKGGNTTGDYCIIPVRYYHPEVVDRVFVIIETLQRMANAPTWVLNFNKQQMVSAVSDLSSGVPRAGSNGKLADSLIPTELVQKVSGKIPNTLIPERILRGTIVYNQFTESFKTELKQEFTGVRG